MIVVLLLVQSVVIVKAYFDFQQVDDAWKSNVTGVAQKSQLIHDLKSEIGYGGFIHHFKNYLLRNNKEYWLLAESDLQQGLAILSAYRKLDNSHDELEAIADIEYALRLYREMLNEAKSAVETGLSIEDIDDSVKVYDGDAINALNELMLVLQQQEQATNQTIIRTTESGEKLAIFGLTLLLLGLIAYWYLARVVIKLSDKPNQKEAYFDVINASLPVGLIITDQYGVIEKRNQEAEHLFAAFAGKPSVSALMDFIPQAENFQTFKKLSANNNGHFSIEHEGQVRTFRIRFRAFVEDNENKYAITLEDVTEVEEVQRQLKSSMAEVAAFNRLLNIHSSVSQTDLDGKIIFVNDNFCSITGYSRNELIGQDHRILASDKHSKVFWKSMWKTISSGEIWHGEVTNRRKDGSMYWIFSTIMPFKDENGNIYKYVAARTDITKIKKAENQIHQLAYRDPLTHQPNMALFKVSLDEMLIKIQKHESIGKLIVADLHINDLMDINSTFGWDYGDKLIQTVAEQLETTDLGAEMIAKVSGERFAFLLHSENHVDVTIESFKQHLSSLFASSFIVDGKPVTVSYSVGMIVLPDDCSELENDHNNASNINNYLELCRVEASKSRGNKYIRFNKSLLSNVSKRTLILHSIEEALEQNELYMVYQPQLSLKDGRVVGVEALMRWKKDDGSYVSPGDFIPVLELSDFIHRLTIWCIKQCFRDLAEIHKALPECRLGINISANFLTDDALMDTLDKGMAQYHVTPSQIELEVTESAIMEDMDNALEQLQKVKEKGFRVSIDDFGTGYSSLSYLVQFPVDQLKIDKSFIRQISHSKQSLSIVNTIISLGKELNLDVIAEGAETQEQIDILRQQECDEVQGFYYAKPMKLSDLLVWLNQAR